MGHILSNNSLPKHVIKGKKRGRIEVTGRRGIRRQQLMDNFNPYPANVDNMASSYQCYQMADGI